MNEDELLGEYVRGLFAVEDDVLRDLRQEIARQGLPEINISPEQGRLIQVLLRAIGARRVVEIGTLGGYSAVWMARALPPDGRLISFEIHAARAAFAREFVRRADLESVVDIRVADAARALSELDGAEPFDAAFIDADKERYPTYLDEALRLVRPGGLVIADNAFWSGRVADEDAEEETTRGVRELNRRMASDPRLTATIIPIRDGMAVGVLQTPASPSARTVPPT